MAGIHLNETNTVTYERAMDLGIRHEVRDENVTVPRKHYW